MENQYNSIHIQSFWDKQSPAYPGEEGLEELLSTFSCPPNPDIEHFLLHNAIDFTKKKQSITYLVFRTSDISLVGYFTLAIRPISINASLLSKTMSKKLARSSVFDEESQTYTTAAYLIAQLGKNYSLPKDRQISGTDLLTSATEKILHIQHFIGGVLQFLECRENQFLMDFYTKNHFSLFDTRVITSSPAPYTLNQLLKFI